MALPRREWLKTLATATFGAVGFPLLERAQAQTRRGDARIVAPLALKDYQPKSMLHVP
jgi:hypothetical protein